MTKFLQFFISHRLRALLRKEFAQIRRDRRLAMSLIIPPTLQLLLFSFVLNATVSDLKLGIIDDSRTPESRGLTSTLTESKSFKLAGYYYDVGKLGDAISRGEFTINGFRNRDLRELLFEDADASPRDQRRHAAAVSRKLALLRMHRLIRKLTGTHRYHLTVHGRIVVTATITARNTSTQVLTRLAA